jgi:hypothetical protein
MIFESMDYRLVMFADDEKLFDSAVTEDEIYTVHSAFLSQKVIEVAGQSYLIIKGSISSPPCHIRPCIELRVWVRPLKVLAV